MNYRSNKNNAKFYSSLARLNKDKLSPEKSEELNKKASEHNKKAKL